MYLSTNNGINWTQSGLSSYNILSIAASNNYVFAGIFAGDIFSTNNGTNWTNKGLNTVQVNASLINGANVFAGTDAGAIFQLTMEQTGHN